jgi:hypothetical protein
LPTRGTTPKCSNSRQPDTAENIAQPWPTLRVALTLPSARRFVSIQRAVQNHAFTKIAASRSALINAVLASSGGLSPANTARQTSGPQDALRRLEQAGDGAESVTPHQCFVIDLKRALPVSGVTCLLHICLSVAAAPNGNSTGREPSRFRHANRQFIRRRLSGGPSPRCNYPWPAVCSRIVGTWPS